MQYLLQDVAINMTWARKEEPSVYRLVVTAQVLRLYCSPVFFLVGIVGGVLSIKAFSWKKFQAFSCVPYLILASVVDICFLCTWMLYWLHIFGVDMYSVRGGCQAVTILSSACAFLSVWCLVLAMVDRAWGMSSMPRIMCTTLKSKMFIGLLVAVSLVVYVNLSLLYGVLRMPTGEKLCVPLSTTAKVTKTLSQLDAIWNFILPYSGLALLSLWCFRKIRVDRTRRNALITGNALRSNILLPSFQVGEFVYSCSQAQTQNFGSGPRRV